MKPSKLEDVKVGDTVIRNLGGAPCPQEVTALTDDLIVCDMWTYCRKTGVEIDEDLGWGPEFGITGSYLMFSDTPYDID